MSAIELDGRGLLVACPECGQRNRMPYDQLGQIFRCGSCRKTLPPPSAPLEVKSEALFHVLTGCVDLPILIDFWAPWCGPCKAIAPELARVAADGAGIWLVAKVNTEEMPGLAERFRISGIPTFVLYRNGAEIGRESGAMPAAAIRQFIEQHAQAGIGS